jgi:adenine-specific DNA-methyltransferase
MNYKEVIESRYNRQNWQLLLHDIFGNKIKFWNTPSTIPTSSQFAKQALWLGTITLSDNQTISIYEVELSDSVDIERNRRGIRDMLLTDWRNNGNAGAFMFCYRKKESVLRFSYVSEAWTFADDGSYQKESTDAKRFTYLLGEGHRSRTAIQQFEKLRDSSLTLKDLTKAFSVDAVSDMFFDGYKKQYEDIIQYITGKRMVKVANKWEEQIKNDPCEEIMQEFAHFPNPEKAVRDYVKKLMGRLVFLQFLQKKGWLGVPAGAEWGTGDAEFIQTLFAQCQDKDHFIDNVLESLFNDLNSENEKQLPQYRTPYLNGGLFERDATDETEFPLPAKYMQSLLDFFASYNFTIDENDPDDAEVGVDPEMLGRIFENLLEDNKDKGAFYTPKEIVSYMCRESLIAYLQTGIEDETTKEAICQFVITHDVATLGTNDRFRQQVDEALKNVKICDPAIGSGAFPMGLLKELFQCRTALEGISQHQAAEIKKHIIQQNIYGVDIERGAVDIARLRFWLSLIVDEETPQALPNLDFKIMQGNSLLEQYKGVDLSTMTEKKADESGMLSIFDSMLDVYRLDLRKMLAKYYDCTDHHKKQSLRKEIVENVKKQLKEQGINVDFGDLDLSGNNQFMLWHIWFYDVFADGGFDIVIGNPPYIGVKDHKAHFDKVREGSLREYFIGKMDYFYFFFHHAINILRNQGNAAFITTNYYVTADGAIKLRRHLNSDCSIKMLVNLGEMKLFENAPGQHNMITLFSKNTNDEERSECRIIDVHRTGALNEHLFSDIIGAKDERTSYSSKSQLDLFEGNGFYIRLDSSSNNSIEKILKKISNGNETIRDICDINQGIVSGADYVSPKHKENYTINAQKGDGIFVLSCSNVHDIHVIESISNSESESLLMKVFFKNSDISKYITNTKSDKKILFIGKDIKTEIELSQEYPIIYNHLKEFRTIMIDKRQSLNEKTDQWFTLNRGTSHPEVFQREKIVCPQRSKTNTFGYNDIDWYAASDVFYLTNPKPGYKIKYILALLNSKLYYVWLYNRGKRKGESLELTATPLSEIPIAMADEDTQIKIIEKVNNIQKGLKGDPLADITADKNEIDNLVYHLYNLTYEEVLSIDPETPITKEIFESKE